MVLVDRSGEEVSILNIVENTEEVQVYNLTVVAGHTYYVTTDEVLVHNAGGGCRPLTSVDMNHIIYGDKKGGWHHRPGGVNYSNFSMVKLLTRPINSNAPYSMLVRTPQGRIKKSSFWPNSWSTEKVRGVINETYQKALIDGGNIGVGKYTLPTNHGFEIIVEFKRDGSGGLKVVNAHPNL